MNRRAVTGVRLASSLRFHVADRRNRMFLCGCAPWFRIGDGVCACLSRRKHLFRTRRGLGKYAIRGAGRKAA